MKKNLASPSVRAARATAPGKVYFAAKIDVQWMDEYLFMEMNFPFYEFFKLKDGVQLLPL